MSNFIIKVTIVNNSEIPQIKNQTRRIYGGSDVEKRKGNRKIDNECPEF